MGRIRTEERFLYTPWTGKETEHEVILYCEAHPEIRIIDAIAVIFKDERARLGIEMK